MLLEKIDFNHYGRYNFFYLPIDPKNHCNVGYAFINFAQPGYILPFYDEFNAKSLGRFNSSKIIDLTYGRIQGKRALVNNFSHQVDRKVRPLILDLEFFD